MRLLPCVAFFVASALGVVVGQLETAFEWQYLDYVWPSEAKKQEAIQKGTYNLSKPVPMDVDVSRDGRVFITSLNYPGVPARLGVVSNVTGPSGPLIQPYPSWDWTDRDSCDSIIEVYRIAIDRCNRLWVLDSATIVEGEKRKCHPKLLAFDLSTDTLISKVVIPENIASNPKTNLSLFVNVKVETYGHECENTTVYMADGLGNGLVIWNGADLYRLESPEFNPEPEAMNVTVGDESAIIPIGIVGMDISPSILPDESRLLYFRPIASYGLFYADTGNLKNTIYGEEVEIFGVNDVLSSQTLGHAFSSEGTLFLGLTKEIAIACWNRYTELKQENIEIVAQDNERLQYANGLKVISGDSSMGEELWMITNGYIHNALHGGLDINKINFRILTSPVKTLTAGTKCQIPSEQATRMMNRV